MSEETVTQETTIYVNSESGRDSEDVRGNSPETAFRTIQYAMDYSDGVMKSNSRTVIVLDGKKAHFLATSGATMLDGLDFPRNRRFEPVDLCAYARAAVERVAATEGVIILNTTSVVTGHGGVGKPAELDLRSMIKSLSSRPGKNKQSKREMSQAPFRRGGRG